MHFDRYEPFYRAMTLEERINGISSRSEIQASERREEIARATKRFQVWKAQKPFDQGTLFAERLAQESITEESLLRLLAEPVEMLRERTPSMPGWIQTLVEALEHTETGREMPLPGQEQERLLNASLRIFSAFIHHGYERLKAGMQTCLQQFSMVPFDPDAIAETLLAYLPRQILPQVDKALVLELHIAGLEQRLQGTTTRERFANFIEQLSQPERLWELLQEYPVLACCIVTTVEQWVDSSLELLQRLCADWQDIRAAFAPESDPGLLVEIKCGAGDRHHNGRSVHILQFERGLQLVYKPKPLAIDQHFQELLVWLNKRGASPAFQTFQIIDRGSYGWCEFLREASCSSIAEVERFYERQGSYLALLYGLHGGDMHAENVIAVGEHPMFIDLEALFDPPMESEQRVQQDTSAEQIIRHSVLWTGLLPSYFEINAQTRGIDISGLGREEGQLTSRPVAQWRDSGTDQMHLVYDYAQLSSSHNRPRLNNKDVNLLDYCEQLMQGFRHMYHLLMELREELLTGPLLRFTHDEIRRIMRGTNVYMRLLLTSFHPDLLHDALDRDCFFDHLWASASKYPQHKYIIGAEQQALLRGDIPLFTTRPGSRAIFAEDGRSLTATFFDEPGITVVYKRFQALNEEDLERQLWFIRAALASTQSILEYKPGLPLQPSLATIPPTEIAVMGEQARTMALALGRRLVETALRGEHGVSWLILSPEGQWHIRESDSSLYNGTSGIALFLGYLGMLCEDSEMTALAKATAATAYAQVKQQKKRTPFIGAFDGIGSVIYMLSHLGTLWNEETLIEQAEELTTLLPGLIEQDVYFDIINGTAGCLMSLLTLYQVSPTERTLQMAMSCGEHLLIGAQQMEAGLGWTIVGQKVPLTGLAHGNAGIALSLCKLAAVSGQERFQQAAQAAITYERSFFSSQKRNWRDLRVFEGERQEIGQEAERRVPVAWCHGAPGIGLSRLEMLHYAGDSRMYEEIEVALQTTWADSFNDNHSLCHGMLGNLELFIRAQEVLEDYQRQGAQWARMLLESIAKSDWLLPTPLDVETPGLMIGLAGIGYGLLRWARPERVPSVLLLSPPSGPGTMF